MSAPTANIGTLCAMAVAGVVTGYALFKLYSSYLTDNSTNSQKSVSNETSSNNTTLMANDDQDSWDPTEFSMLLSQFQLACEYMQTRHGKALELSNEEKLKLYSCFKTATVGPNTTSKPSMLDFERSVMWKAWKACDGMKRSEGMIGYVELVHQKDPKWREKVVSKSLERVMGENATMACDPTKDDESGNDDEDKLFDENRKKTNLQRDEERRHQIEEKKRLDDLERQKRLREKYSGMYGQFQQDTNNETENATNGEKKVAKNGKGDMGPVFSSAAKVNRGNDTDADKLEVTSFSIDTNTNTGNNNQNNEKVEKVENVEKIDETNETENQTAETQTDDKSDDTIEVLEADTTTIRQGGAENNDKANNIDDDDDDDENGTSSSLPTASTPAAHSIQAGEVFIRVHSGSFRDLAELDSLSLFQEVVESENILAIIGKYPHLTQSALKNDQNLLFSFSVVLVDVNRMTLIHAVAERGKVEQMGILLHTFKYPIDLKDSEGNTPLMLAIGSENVKMVEYLIKTGANLQEKQADGTTIEDLVDLCDNEDLQQIILGALKK